jgi:hypothetical protein
MTSSCIAAAIMGSVLILMIGLIIMQKAHYDYLREAFEVKSLSELGHDVENTFKEFDEYKKRVDSLVFRSGFKP